MIELWWVAHKFEFVIAGGIIGLFIAGVLIIGIVQLVRAMLGKD